MLKFFLFVVTIFSIGIVHAQSSVVCSWQNSAGRSFSTDGYNWGGSSFSTREDCGIALRATLLSVDFGQGNASGTATFTDKIGVSSSCIVKNLKYPFTQYPNGFSETMERAYEGKSSVAELSKFKSYLDENLAFICH